MRQYFYNWASQKGPSGWSQPAPCIYSTCWELLLYVRLQMQSLAGKIYTESEMTYGQQLAALSWVPVIVEYVYHMTCECTDYWIRSIRLEKQ